MEHLSSKMEQQEQEQQQGQIECRRDKVQELCSKDDQNSYFSVPRGILDNIGTSLALIQTCLSASYVHYQGI